MDCTEARAATEEFFRSLVDKGIGVIVVGYIGFDDEAGLGTRLDGQWVSDEETEKV